MKSDDFTRGVFSTMQYLVVVRGELQLAAEIANENAIRQKLALKLSKESGFEVCQMNRFIRAELRGD
jgi:hypothetical protein